MVAWCGHIVWLESCPFRSSQPMRRVSWGNGPWNKVARLKYAESMAPTLTHPNWGISLALRAVRSKLSNPWVTGIASSSADASCRAA